MGPQGDTQDRTSTVPLGMARNNRSSRKRRTLHKGLGCVGVDKDDEPHSLWN
jgi:hypothetical protein